MFQNRNPDNHRYNDPDAQLELQCLRCKQNSNTLLQLECQHQFCLMCITYFYIKFREQVESTNDVKCILCQVVSNLSVHQLQLINQTFQTRVIPLVSQENNLSTENKYIRSKRNSSQNSNQPLETIEKRMRSAEHSIDKITPEEKYFYSKCESPNNNCHDLPSAKFRERCFFHDRNQAKFVCFTCSHRLLCMKCIGTKEHYHHDLQSIEKGATNISEQISFYQLETSQKIDHIQMWQRRIQHHKKVIADRAKKSLEELDKAFQDLLIKLANKSNQVIDNCRRHYDSLIATIDEEDLRISTELNRLKKYKGKLQTIMSCDSPQQLFGQFDLIKDHISHSIKSKQPNFHEKLSFEETPLNKEIYEIQQCINRIKIDFRPIHTIIPKGKNILEKSKSDKKIKRDQNSKRVKTNFASLNSSRDKRDIKCAKTEEDQTRYRNKAHLREMGKGPSNALPPYITKFIDKHNQKIGSNGMSCVYDFQPQIYNSKTSSKLLSKTVVPEEFEKRKRKDHISLAKDRVQRKTVNPNQSKMLKSEHQKKRKVHY